VLLSSPLCLSFRPFDFRKLGFNVALTQKKGKTREFTWRAIAFCIPFFIPVPTNVLKFPFYLPLEVYIGNSENLYWNTYFGEQLSEIGWQISLFLVLDLRMFPKAKTQKLHAIHFHSLIAILMAPPTNPEQESEALHLKTIAESKFKASNNAKSALKYSKHAQRLCPQY